MEALIQGSLERIAHSEKLAQGVVFVALDQLLNNLPALLSVQVGSQRWVHGRSGRLFGPETYFSRLLPRNHSAAALIKRKSVKFFYIGWTATSRGVCQLLVTDLGGMAAKLKKMFGFGHDHRDEEEEEEQGEGAAGGGDERRPKFADEKGERKPRFAEPAPPSGKKQPKKVVTVEVPTEGGGASKHKPTTVHKKPKPAAAPQGVSGEGGRGEDPV